MQSSPESLYTTMTKSLPMWRFLLQQPLSLSLLGISVAMWKMPAETRVHRPRANRTGNTTRDYMITSTAVSSPPPTRLTLHDVIVPAVGELSVVSVLVEPSEEDLVGVAVLQVD
ncbi:hypothetical protein EYF80_020275 [Liparis tanakae]|uniref:Uncharacterized protein n=1 Tax=Liparis tanakae TaxID=230148 RepID=A0A4Z2HV35_9TELE|nr:hypothetical protein EYF80_020275 [Liparis tanakae]